MIGLLCGKETMTLCEVISIEYLERDAR